MNFLSISSLKIWHSTIVVIKFCHSSTMMRVCIGFIMSSFCLFSIMANKGLELVTFFVELDVLLDMCWKVNLLTFFINSIYFDDKKVWDGN